MLRNASNHPLASYCLCSDGNILQLLCSGHILLRGAQIINLELAFLLVSDKLKSLRIKQIPSDGTIDLNANKFDLSNDVIVPLQSIHIHDGTIQAGRSVLHCHRKQWMELN